MANAIKDSIVKALAKGGFVSGQSLADELGVSRAAVSNHVSSLSKMGLDIFKVRGKGYQLAAPIAMLDLEQVQQTLKALGKTNEIEVHNIIDSTNNYLLRKLPHQIHQGQVCLAEFQEAGRGRRGKQWLSPFGSHLYLSMYHKLELGMSQAMGLSLVSALAVKDTLQSLYQISVQLKWPNDVYVEGKKIAGILIDLEGQAIGDCHSVIGIGLNVQMPDSTADQIDQPWTDIASIVNEVVDRNALAATLIGFLDARIKQQKETGLKSMLTEWHRHDIFLDKPIDLLTGNKTVAGICRGINEQGAMLMEVDGEIKTIYGGEVSVRSRS